MNYPWNQPNGPRQQPNQQYIQPGMNQQYQPPPFQQQQFMSPQQFHPPPNHQIPHYQQPYIAPPPQAMIQPKASTPGGPLIHQGRRRALLIGINYTGQRAQLSGCQNDIRNVRNFITNVYQFPSDPNSMVVLTDDQRNPAFIPTRINIINAMHWLVSAAQPGDEFFFQYSGHGGQADDRDGDEIDGKDETILPLDHQHAGVILDDEMHAIMIRNLPRGARFVAIFGIFT